MIKLKKIEYIVELSSLDSHNGSIHSNHGSGQLDLFEDLLSHKDMNLKGKFKITGEPIHLSQDKEFFSKMKVKKKEKENFYYLFYQAISVFQFFFCFIHNRINNIRYIVYTIYNPYTLT